MAVQAPNNLVRLSFVLERDEVIALADETSSPGGIDQTAGIGLHPKVLDASAVESFRRAEGRLAPESEPIGGQFENLPSFGDPGETPSQKRAGESEEGQKGSQEEAGLFLGAGGADQRGDQIRRQSDHDEAADGQPKAQEHANEADVSHGDNDL